MENLELLGPFSLRSATVVLSDLASFWATVHAMKQSIAEKSQHSPTVKTQEFITFLVKLEQHRIPHHVFFFIKAFNSDVLTVYY